MDRDYMKMRRKFWAVKCDEARRLEEISKYHKFPEILLDPATQRSTMGFSKR